MSSYNNTSYYKRGSANKCFATFTQNQTAGDYIYNKKAKASFCYPNINNSCVSIKNVNSENNFLLFKTANTLQTQSPLSTINNTDLYINLITTMNLSGVTVIEDLSGNTIPVPIYPNTDQNQINLNYNIDPCGNLFGNRLCGEIDPYKNYMVYNVPST
jgi:hypothetical protein